jgi:hypothetical protein
MSRVPSTFEEACALLKNHQKGSDTPEETLNRLFKKHLKGRPEIAAGAPRLSDKNTQLKIEIRSKQEFVGLPLKQEAQVAMLIAAFSSFVTAVSIVCWMGVTGAEPGDSQATRATMPLVSWWWSTDGLRARQGPLTSR